MKETKTVSKKNSQILKRKEARILPHSIESEQCVLGCALIDQDASFGVMTELKPDDFYSETHRIIFEAMANIFATSTPIDFITVTENLDKNGLLASVGGVEYLTTLTGTVPSASNYKYYINMVKNSSVLRQLIGAGQDIIDKSYDDISKEDAITFAEQSIFTIGEKEQRGGLSPISDAVSNTIKNFEILHNNKGTIKGVPTGIYGIDKTTNGLQNGTLVLIAARPGCGKTSLGMNIVDHAAVKCGKKCAIFSLEMSKEEIAARSICSLAYVDMTHATHGEMNDNEWKAIISASRKLSEASIFIDEGFSSTPATILSKCRKLKREKGLDLVMIDYLQLMNSSKPIENRTQEISDITRELKKAARELDVPIILLSQLSRESEKRAGNHRPILSDLRESGSIEQDADIVLFIYRPDMYNDVPDEEKAGGQAEIIFAKNRAGQTPTVKVKWVGKITSFLNLEKDANAQSLEGNEPVDPNPRPVKKVDVKAMLQEDEELIPLPTDFDVPNDESVDKNADQVEGEKSDNTQNDAEKNSALDAGVSSDGGTQIVEGQSDSNTQPESNSDVPWVDDITPNVPENQTFTDEEMIVRPLDEASDLLDIFE